MKNTNLFLDYLVFIKKPSNERFNSMNIKSRIISFIFIFILTFIVVWIASFPYSILANLKIIPVVENLSYNKILDYKIRNDNNFNIYIFVHLFFSILFFIVMYILPITKYNFNRFIISISMILSVLILPFFDEKLSLISDNYIYHTLVYSSLTIASSVIFFYFFKSLLKRKLVNFEEKWNNNYNRIFYIYVILMTITTIFSYNINIQNVFSVILILLPSFVCNVSFGYTRIRIGIVESILLISLFNLIYFIPFLI